MGMVYTIMDVCSYVSHHSEENSDILELRRTFSGHLILARSFLEFLDTSLLFLLAVFSSNSSLTPASPHLFLLFLCLFHFRIPFFVAHAL